MSMTTFLWCLLFVSLLIALYFYLVYRASILTMQILKSAGQMKTGNDLGEQLEKIQQKKIPNFFQFYWRAIRRR